MRSLRLLRLCLVLVLLASSRALGDQIIISAVPSYTPGWYGGCGPTAGGMVIGYWDDHGYPGLIPVTATGDGTNSWTTNQTDIKAMIASDGYFTDYWPTPDQGPTHADDCVADFMETSRDGVAPQGWTKATQIDDGLTGYANSKGYSDTRGSWWWYSEYLWEVLVGEIDHNRPMVLYVDASGDGTSDHFVTAIGYDNTPGAFQYGCYDYTSNNKQWYDFIPPTDKHAYGVETGTWFTPFVPVAPVAKAGGPYTLTLGPIELDGSTSFDTDGAIIAWDWDLNGNGIYGDARGEQPEVDSGLLDLLGWKLGEKRTIALMVMDGQGKMHEASTTLTYLPEPATIVLLALGCAGLAARRARKRSTSSAAG